MRDDFDTKTRNLLAERVSYRCSNPKCGVATRGPHSDKKRSISIGVAAHITAASPNGPRYDPNLSEADRKSPENGIWLCQNCAWMIDRDEARYTVKLLNTWKELTEQEVSFEIEQRKRPTDLQNDLELIRFYSKCLDRPAFQDPFESEGSMEDFDKAIEDTVTALNTGVLFTRNNTKITEGKGKSYLVNSDWRNKMDVVVDLLRAIRSQFAMAVNKNDIHLGLVDNQGRQFYNINNREVVRWMDDTRSEIIRIFNGICDEAGVDRLSFPRDYRKHLRW